MAAFFTLVWLVCTVWFVVSIVKARRKTGPVRNVAISFVAGFIALIIGGALSPDPPAAASSTSAAPVVTTTPSPAPTSTPAPKPAATSSKEVAALKAQLAAAKSEAAQARQAAAQAQQEADAAKQAAQADTAPTPDPEPVAEEPAAEEPDAAPTVSNDGTLTIVSDGYFGCTERDTFNKAVKYAVQKDTEAFSSYLGTALMSGECTTFKSGETVHLEDTAFFSGMMKVRRPGELDEFWTNLEAAK